MHTPDKELFPYISAPTTVPARRNRLPRQRVTRACDRCNRLRTKCDGEQPCKHCVDYGLECEDKRERKKRGKQPTASLKTSSTNPKHSNFSSVHGKVVSTVGGSGSDGMCYSPTGTTRSDSITSIDSSVSAGSQCSSGYEYKHMSACSESTIHQAYDAERGILPPHAQTSYPSSTQSPLSTHQQQQQQQQSPRNLYQPSFQPHHQQSLPLHHTITNSPWFSMPSYSATTTTTASARAANIDGICTAQHQGNGFFPGVCWGCDRNAGAMYISPTVGSFMPFHPHGAHGSGDVLEREENGGAVYGK